MKKIAPSPITLRELTLEEMPGIFPLIKAHNPKMTKTLFRDRLTAMLPLGYRALAAFQGEAMVAVSGFWIRTRFWCGKQLDVDNFFVDEACRSGGVGAQMLGWLEQKALAEDCELMVLDVYSDNTLAQRFYHRMGFTITGYHFTKIPGTTTPYGRSNPH
jgi:ribosomal protein S18 acetylase RimI-like enzyme